VRTTRIFSMHGHSPVIVAFYLAAAAGVDFCEAFRPTRTATSYYDNSVHRIRGGALEEGDDNDKEQGENAKSSQDMYNKQATNWVRTSPRCLSDFTGRPVVFGMLAEELQNQDPKTIVLDVGCGEGYCARKVIELGAAKVIGNDISQEMVNSAQQTAEGDDRFQFYASPVGNLLRGLEEHMDEAPNEMFDVAMAVFLFNYLTTGDMEDAILQIFQALKPGGIFVFSVPHPSMIFCHDKGSVFHLESQGKGYFSSRNEKILGQISTIDGTKLNIMSVHKTVGDYIKAITSAGFHIIDIQEAGVTEEHMALHPDFFKSVNDRPLHLVFKLKKP
jgi:SAM-dependent methyltransferase